MTLDIVRRPTQSTHLQVMAMKLLNEGAVSIEEKLTSSPRKVDASFILFALSVLVVLHGEGTLFLGLKSKKWQNESGYDHEWLV